MRCQVSTSSGSQQEPIADPTGPPWQRETGTGCILHSPSWCGICTNQRARGLEEAGQQLTQPVSEQETLLHCLHATCVSTATDHQLSLTCSHHTWPQGFLLPGLTHKNRLQLPDKQLERLPHPERRSTQNISTTDTHRCKVFALHELSKGRKMPSIKQEAEISPLALDRLLKHSNCVLTYKDQKTQSLLQRSHLHCKHSH